VDLNYLLHRQQVERARADNAECEEARSVHAKMARSYEAAILKATDGELAFPGEAASSCAESLR
jgi:hypothetical protein